MTLQERPAISIVRAVAGAASRWSDADFPPRIRVLDALCARTGYSLPVVEYALDRIFFALEQRAIEDVIAAELGSVAALDGFVERRGLPRARALPAGRVCVVSSRTTIGVAIVPAVMALCAKCDVLVKDREDCLVGAFFATLREELDEFAAAAVAQTWDARTQPRAFDEFACVVAFGRDETLTEIRAQLRPQTRFVPFGSKASAGYVAREALGDAAAARAVAQGAARDLVLYDTQGCLSLHALFVERGGAIAPDAFAALLAHAIERAAVEFPAGPRTPGEAADTASARDLAAFRAAAGRGRVYSDAAASYVAVLDPPADEPPPFLPRSLGVRSVDEPREAARYLQRHGIALEALAVAGMRPDVVALAIDAGAARIAPFGELQAPPLGVLHGGRPRIADFVRWITDET